MFAVSKIVRNRLYVLRCPTKEDDDFDVMLDLLDRWQDTMYLYQILKKHSQDLKFYNLSIKEAAKQITHENNSFYQALIDAAQDDSGQICLDLLFEPLHKESEKDLLVQVKAYGAGSTPSITRIYAIKLLDGSYVIVGGLIKFGRALKDFDEGKELLRLINKVKIFFEKNGLLDAETLKDITKESDHY